MGEGKAWRAATLAIVTTPLRSPPLDRVAVSGAIQRGRGVKTSDAIAGVKLDADLKCVLGSNLQQVDFLVTEDSPALGIDMVALSPEVLEPVVRGRAADGCEVVHQVAGSAFPVEV